MSLSAAPKLSALVNIRASFYPVCVTYPEIAYRGDMFCLWEFWRALTKIQRLLCHVRISSHSDAPSSHILDASINGLSLDAQIKTRVTGQNAVTAFSN
jgi:hypothetical protein